jgi:DNA-binding transcriptional ArsR family regulator
MSTAAVFDALGDATRREIVRLLAEEPRSVGELAEQLPVSRPAVSQHLRVLASAELVTARADGTRRVYRLDGSGAARAREYLDRMWDTALDRFTALAEESP